MISEWSQLFLSFYLTFHLPLFNWKTDSILPRKNKVMIQKFRKPMRFKALKIVFFYLQNLLVTPIPSPVIALNGGGDLR